MNNSKTIIETIKSSLLNDETLSSVLIKFQLFAQELNSPELLKWVLCELNGYADTDPIPEYRRIGIADIKAEVLDRFGIPHTITIPLGLNLPDNYSSQLYSADFRSSIAELEAQKVQCDNNSHFNLRRNLHGAFFSEIEKCFEGEYFAIQQLSQYFAGTSIAGIILSIKSRLLTYIHEVSTNIDFEQISNEEAKAQANQFFYCNIYALNVGSGTINTNSNNTAIGTNSSISINETDLSKLSELWNELDKLKVNINEDADELAQYLVELKAEIDNKISCPSAVKKTLRAIKSLITKAGEVAVEHGIDQCINMLSNYL